MRFHPAKGLATAGAIVAILAVAACSSSSSSTSSTPPPAATSAASTPSTGSTSGAGSASASAGTSSGAEAQITTNWEKFFSSATPVSERVMYLQNGSTFSTTISSLSSNPLAAALSASVTSVTLTSATQATVKYNLVSSGTTVLPNQTGTAVLENGTWKVGDVSFCGLLSQAGTLMKITVPAACKSA